MQLQEIQSANSLLSTNDVEIQCSIDENEQTVNPDESIDKETFDRLNDENEELKTDINGLNNKKKQLEIQLNTINDKNAQLTSETNVLKEEINNLNFQLSSITIQRSASNDVS